MNHSLNSQNTAYCFDGHLKAKNNYPLFDN